MTGPATGVGINFKEAHLRTIRSRSRSTLTHADVLGRDRPGAGLIMNFVPCCPPIPLTRLPHVPGDVLLAQTGTCSLVRFL